MLDKAFEPIEFRNLWNLVWGFMDTWRTTNRMPKEEEKEYLKILGVDKYPSDKGSCWIYHTLLVLQCTSWGVHHAGTSDLKRAMEYGFTDKFKAPVSSNLFLKKTSLSHYLLESVGLSRIAHYFADDFEIKRAYKRLALQFHPDKVCTQCNIVSLIMAVLSFCCSNSLFCVSKSL